MGGLAEESILTPILKGQYQHMLDFVNTQWHSITSFIAGLEEVNENTAGQIADYVAKDSESELSFLEYLNWGKTMQFHELFIKKYHLRELLSKTA